MVLKATESRNSKSMNIDQEETLNILKTINLEDQEVPKIIGDEKILDQIKKIVDVIVENFKNGGRLFYMGAGTSGRLGILDAAECVPTYGTDPEMVQGLIAGGQEAVVSPVEGAEDSRELGEKDLQSKFLSKKDFVLGIAASGSTPYVIGGLDYAKSVGAKTGSLCCNLNSEISKHSDFPIEAIVGPEVVTGSTRMKAGTAEKLILNMISTTSMIKIGKVYSNLMVDVKPTNIKLVDRAKRIISDAANLEFTVASEYYEKAEHQPKAAIVMIKANVSLSDAEVALKHTGGFISEAIKYLDNGSKE